MRTTAAPKAKENAVNYFNQVSALLAARLPDCRPELIRYYTLLALTTGADTTLEHVHDAWSAWRVDSDRPDHPSIVWFGVLPSGVQVCDEMYRDAITEVAREAGALRSAA